MIVIPMFSVIPIAVALLIFHTPPQVAMMALMAHHHVTTPFVMIQMLAHMHPLATTPMRSIVPGQRLTRSSHQQYGQKDTDNLRHNPPPKEFFTPILIIHPFFDKYYKKRKKAGSDKLY